MLFDFDDILIEPEIHTSISSKTSIDVLDGNNMLPIITLPMDTPGNKNNSKLYNDYLIYYALLKPEDLPKKVSIDPRIWVSYGLNEFKSIFIDNLIEIKPKDKVYALIYLTNGHVKALKELIISAKKIYGDSLVLMAGNCAHPLTFLSLSQAGTDYVIISGDLRTSHTGIGYPMGSLIHECSKYQIERELDSKIVAYKGFKDYSDVIKALALGADYIMLGSEFDRILGMHPMQKIKYSLSELTSNFKDNLRTAMKYTDCSTIGEFIGKVKFNHISKNSFERFVK